MMLSILIRRRATIPRALLWTQSAFPRRDRTVQLHRILQEQSSRSTGVQVLRTTVNIYTSIGTQRAHDQV